MNTSPRSGGSELGGGQLLVEEGDARLVAVAVAALFLDLQHVGPLGRVELQLGEDVLGVQQLGVDLLGSEVAHADHEYLGGFIARSLRLSGFHPLEELVEDPQ